LFVVVPVDRINGAAEVLRVKPTTTGKDVDEDDERYGVLTSWFESLKDSMPLAMSTEDDDENDETTPAEEE
jgi:hypothetical protein